MKSSCVNTWLIGILIVFLFISFSITLPSVSAQEGTPPIPTATPTGTLVLETEESPIATATPTETTGDNTFFPTATPTAFTEETPVQAQEAERQVGVDPRRKFCIQLRCLGNQSGKGFRLQHLIPDRKDDLLLAFGASHISARTAL